MIAYDKIIDRLKQRWKAGETQVEIAKSAGISQSYLCDLISGKADIEGLSLKKINKLFPEATLNLGSDTVSIHTDNNCGNVVGVNRGRITSDCISAVLDKILESEELSDAEKVKVMRVLNR